MNLQQQKDLLTIYKQYQETDKNTIKANLRHYMDIKNIKLAELSDLTGIPLQTIYQLRKFNNPYKPDFINSLIICNTLQIPITAIMQSLLNIYIKEPETKWTITAKKKFVNDYNRLNIDELTKKYSITERTSVEYFKNFSRDIEELETV